MSGFAKRLVVAVKGLAKHEYSRAALLLSLVFLLAGCHGPVEPAARPPQPSSAPTDTAHFDSFACGSVTCGPTEYCQATNTGSVDPYTHEPKGATVSCRAFPAPCSSIHSCDCLRSQQLPMAACSAEGAHVLVSVAPVLSRRNFPARRQGVK